MHKDAHSFVMGFIANSKHYRSQYIERWREIMANYVVEPYGEGQLAASNPYRAGRGSRNGTYRSGITLKSGETHKIITTYASKLVLGALGDTRAEYVQAEPVGYEDTKKAATVSKLLRYAFSQEGAFRTLVEAVTDMLLFGTSVVEIPWVYIEREMLVRNIESVGGVELDNFTRETVVAYDDVQLNVIDIQDFYPDPSEYILEKMSGVAKRFRMNAMEARSKVGGPSGYKKDAVEKAIKYAGGKSPDEPRDAHYDENFRENLDQPSDRKSHPDFQEMVGFEYWGEVPWEDDGGSSRRVITVLNNVVVRDIPYPLADECLPFRSLTINPVCGRFYGISPAEVVRYDQDLQDAVKILLAEAIIRQVHPPIAYDPMGEVDLAKIKAWDPDVLIPVQGGPNMIGTVKYDAGVYSGFQLAAAEKAEMQETSGATAGLQGQSLSSKRMSATEAQNTIAQAMDRPELAAALLERDALPKIGKSILRRYQQFIRDTEDLALRVGKMPQPFWIGDILGDYDVRFVGSRMAMSRQQKLQAFDRLVSYISVLPTAQALLPNIEILQMIVGEVLELPEVAQQIGDPQTVLLNMLMQQQAGGMTASNNNGQAVSSEPAGAMPAQMNGAAGG